jgi:hypothetical protein
MKNFQLAEHLFIGDVLRVKVNLDILKRIINRAHQLPTRKRMIPLYSIILSQLNYVWHLVYRREHDSGRIYSKVQIG